MPHAQHRQRNVRRRRQAVCSNVFTRSRSLELLHLTALIRAYTCMSTVRAPQDKNIMQCMCVRVFYGDVESEQQTFVHILLLVRTYCRRTIREWRYKRGTPSKRKRIGSWANLTYMRVGVCVELRHMRHVKIIARNHPRHPPSPISNNPFSYLFTTNMCVMGIGWVDNGWCVYVYI